MADVQTLNNGDSYGVIRGKINANFVEFNTKKIEATDVLTRTNTSPYSPTLLYHPTTKGYVDNLFTSWTNVYDPTNVSADVFDRGNHYGSISAAYVTETTNLRFVSDAEKVTWNAKEPTIGAKGTGFNKNFGTTAGTVSEGNHAHTDTYEPKNVNIQAHIGSTSNPHSVTKTQVGLGNADNTSDSAKPISDLTQAALDLKADQSSVDSKREIANNQFGDITNSNYTEIESDGHIKFVGDATIFEDDNFDPLTLTGGPTAPTAISFSTSSVKIASFVNAATDSVSGNREVPHSAKLAAVIQFHHHWYPTTTNTGVCRFGLEYFFTQDGIAPTFPAIIYAEQAGSGVAWAKQNVAFADITPPNELGCQVHFRFFRDGTHGNDTFTGDAAVSTIGYHFESDGIGSRQINVK